MADYGEAAPEYSVDFGEGDQRTLTVQEIAAEYAGGTITGETYVWTDGFTDWKPLADVADLFRAVKAGPSRATKSSAGRAAARSTAGRSATADLFGGIDSAGGEDEVQTSAPQHDAGSSTSGSRNESSVLFSLSALTSQANQRPSTRPAATSSREDSGLIDLKALTAAAMKSDASAAAAPIAPAVPVAPFGVASPLGIAAPLGGVTATTDIAGGGSKSRAPLYIGGGIAIGMIALAAAIVFRPVPPPPAPIVVAAPPPAVSQAAAAPTAAPTQEAQPPATAGATDPSAPDSEKDKAETGKKTTNAGARKRPAAPSAKKTSEPEAAPAAKPTAAPKKSGGGCGCASGDLQCAIRCAAK